MNFPNFRDFPGESLPERIDLRFTTLISHKKNFPLGKRMEKEISIEKKQAPGSSWQFQSTHFPKCSTEQSCCFFSCKIRCEESCCA